MGVIPKEVKGSGSGGNYLKAVDFEGDGLELEVVGFEKIVAGNADYGANENDFLYTSGRLGEGETFRYTFKRGEETVCYDSKSATFFISFSQADPDAGDTVKIQKSGEGRKTKYDISII